MTEGRSEIGEAKSPLATVEGKPQVITSNQPETAVDPKSSAKKEGLLGTLRGLLRRGQPADMSTESNSGLAPRARIDLIRSEILGPIAQRRSVSKLDEKPIDIFDNNAEGNALNEIRALGGELTEDEFHRLAILTAIQEKPQGVALTEQMVADAEEKLRSGTPNQQRAA